MRIRTKKTLLRAATAVVVVCAAAVVFLPAAASSAQILPDSWAGGAFAALIPSLSAG
jgi:hypothetical protein